MKTISILPARRAGGAPSLLARLQSACALRLLPLLLLLALPAASLAQPSIVAQPQNQLVDPGTAANFAVSVAGPDSITYQWFFNGGPLADSTNRTLRLVNTQPTQTGSYFVVASNASGSISSQLARLKVFVPVLHGFSAITADPNGQVTLAITGESKALFNQYYDLHPVETSFNRVNWFPLTTLGRTNSDLSPSKFVDSDTPEFVYQKFYRTPTNLLITPLPKPSGPYPIGTFSRLLTDPSRTNSARRSNHQFMITFWYPAEIEPGVLPAPYAEKQLAQSSSVYGAFASRVPAFVSHSFSNARPASDRLKYLIILYSCGGGGIRRENTAKTEELASWGYIVVGMDHRDSTRSVFPDGKVVTGSLNASSLASLRSAIDDRVLDAKFVLDELTRMNVEDAVFYDRLELNRIGAFGWSVGGAPAAELARVDDHCKASAGMDGVFLKTNLLPPVADSIPVPSGRRTDPDPAANLNGTPTDDRIGVFNVLTTNAYGVKLTNAVHWSYAEQSLIWDPVTFQTAFGAPPPSRQTSGVRACQIARAYLLSFFNKHLLGQD